MTLDDIKGRCRVEGDCWVWTGAVSKGVPRVWAPDYTLHEGSERSQTGRRAVWHVVHQRAIKKGHRIFGTCGDPLCLNPKHGACRSMQEQGKRTAAEGVYKGNVRKIVANRAIGRKRSLLTPELIELILYSPKKGTELSQETGLKRQLISKVRTHGARSFQTAASPFAGLGG